MIYEIIKYPMSLINVFDDNEDLVKTLLKDQNSYINYNESNMFKKIYNYIFNTSLPFKMTTYKDGNLDFVFNKEEPLVYIYSTHDEEEYLSGYLEGYNLDANVISASLLLQDKLNNLGIKTIVEDSKVSVYRKNNNMNFYQSYQVSRNYILDTLKIYPNLKLIIDLHRDALEREATYIEVDGKKYAKVLFVVGQKYSTYKDNLALSNKIDGYLKKQIPSISKGIMMKNSEQQNGIYNQDINKNIILLELGSNNNTIDEIYNTIEVVAEAIKEALNEDKA